MDRLRRLVPGPTAPGPRHRTGGCELGTSRAGVLGCGWARPAPLRLAVASGTEWLAKYGIELKEAALANIRFDPAYEKAIEDKQIEEQRAEQKLYELVQARRQAEIVAATAKGKGDAARAQADGEADALRTKGQAEATYNANVAASLTPTLIQQQYLVRWNGQLPQYILGEGNNGVFLRLPRWLLR
jgi:regulator of protease activity HflC (stomatin/prohibitin superfamily)